MPYASLRLRDQLGLIRGPDSRTVREALLRKAQMRPPSFSVPAAIDDWFVELGNELPEIADKSHAEVLGTAEWLGNKLHTVNAPAVLAIIAPDCMAPVCSAADLPGRCKAEVKKHLPTFLARVANLLNDPYGAL
jgi:hypothetical protein